MLRYWRGLVREAMGAERSTLGVIDARKDRFIARHKDFVQAKMSLLEQAEGDRILWAEVLAPVEKSLEYRGSPGRGAATDKTVRKPTCLGSPPVEREN